MADGSLADAFALPLFSNLDSLNPNWDDRFTLTEMAQEDYVPGRLASAVRSWDGEVARYKGREKYGEVLLEYLDGEHKKQLDNGLEVEKEEEIRKYPW